MAEEDDAQKTEDPTSKKLEEAHKKGDVPKSQELRHWFILVSAAVAFLIAGRDAFAQISNQLANFLATMHRVDMTPAGIMQSLQDLGGSVVLALLFPLAFLIVGAIAGSMLQHKPLMTFEKMKPELKKINPMQGLKRMFSTNTLMEFAKMLAKFIIVGTVSWFLVLPYMAGIDSIMTMSVGDVLSLTVGLMMRVLLGVIAIMTIIAAIDLVFQRAQHTKKMRMSKQEVKDEHKQMEGDPHVKARLRQIRMERSRKRMIQAVPEADVVITNPTHFAVALKYQHGLMEVPVLVAKGTDNVAAKIREVAKENGVPLIENPPLARALHASVEVDDEIPPEHYEAVAKVISFVMKQRRPRKVAAG